MRAITCNNDLVIVQVPTIVVGWAERLATLALLFGRVVVVKPTLARAVALSTTLQRDTREHQEDGVRKRAALFSTSHRSEPHGSQGQTPAPRPARSQASEA